VKCWKEKMVDEKKEKLIEPDTPIFINLDLDDEELPDGFFDSVKKDPTAEVLEEPPFTTDEVVGQPADEPITSVTAPANPYAELPRTSQPPDFIKAREAKWPGYSKGSTRSAESKNIPPLPDMPTIPGDEPLKPAIESKPYIDKLTALERDTTAPHTLATARKVREELADQEAQRAADAAEQERHGTFMGEFLNKQGVEPGKGSTSLREILGSKDNTPISDVPPIVTEPEVVNPVDDSPAAPESEAVAPVEDGARRNGATADLFGSEAPVPEPPTLPSTSPAADNPLEEPDLKMPNFLETYAKNPKPEELPPVSGEFLPLDATRQSVEDSDAAEVAPAAIIPPVEPAPPVAEAPVTPPPEIAPAAQPPIRNKGIVERLRDLVAFMRKGGDNSGEAAKLSDSRFRPETAPESEQNQTTPTG